MLDWQIEIYIRAQAVICEIEGMKATNDECRIHGNEPAHDEDKFIDKANELLKLSLDMKP